LRVGDGPDARHLCVECRVRQVEVERIREQARTRGPQPAICGYEGCRRPFTASRLGVKFCSSSCRARAWREQRVVA
jgi:hypothetical protein